MDPEKAWVLTNDDGFESPLFQTFRFAFQRLTRNVTSIAPSRQYSWCSKSLTKSGEVAIERSEDGVWHLDGSPATCVQVGLGVLSFPCDIVVSGPNEGHNAGTGYMMSSGTLGGALEAHQFGKLGVAVSFALDKKSSDALDEEESEIRRCVVAALWILHMQYGREKLRGRATEEMGNEVISINMPVPLTLTSDQKHAIDAVAQRIWLADSMDSLDSLPSIDDGMKEEVDLTCLDPQLLPLVMECVPMETRYGCVFSEVSSMRVALKKSYDVFREECPVEGTDVWALQNGFISITRVYPSLCVHHPKKWQ
eukprot:TRINITY_DN10230_c0_g1_i1.p1 TRINITY_DN10230_c0_g1~~TRINITY_DN10230_c0_g1_i1.p1  ORF type:complete len:309 (+),score=67.02 TRINITY_DN10230_c0_g1_i1:130-1056(+)